MGRTAPRPSADDDHAINETKNHFGHGLLAKRLGISTNDIEVASGHSSPSKVLAIYGMDDEAIKQVIP